MNYTIWEEKERKRKLTKGNDDIRLLNEKGGGVIIRHKLDLRE